jgi:hypothetical protein
MTSLQALTLMMA